MSVIDSIYSKDKAKGMFFAALNVPDKVVSLVIKHKGNINFNWLLENAMVLGNFLWSSG